jgi:large subunit ribosomal protein L21
MTYAIIKIGTNQVTATKGAVFKLDRITKLAKPEVLFYSDGKTVKIGSPAVDDVVVKLTKVEDSRDAKIRVGRFKSKSRYKKTNGHRQPISIIKVEDISLKTAKSEEKSEKTDKVEKIAVIEKEAKKTTKLKKEVKE